MTAQVSDRLEIDGEAVDLMGCPALPWHHSRFEELTEAQARELCRGRRIFSTACWRRYVADWHITAGRLHLDRILGIYRLKGEEPLFADWVTDTLRIAVGEQLAYVHMGFGSVYEEDVLLEIRSGIVVGQRRRNNRGVEHDVVTLGWENLPNPATVVPGLKPKDGA